MWEILVPAYDNKGKYFSYEHHKAWDEFVKNLTGGLTIMKTAKGQWMSSSGELYTDKMIPCRIVCTKKQINVIIDFTIEHYNQEAVLAFRISDFVILRHRDVMLETKKITEEWNKRLLNPKNDDVTHTVFFGENIKRATNLLKDKKS